VTLPRCFALTASADRLTLSGRVLPNISGTGARQTPLATVKDDALILELFLAAQGLVVIGVAGGMFLLDSSGEASISALASGGSVWIANMLMVLWMQFRRLSLGVSANRVSASLSVLVAYFFKLLLTCALLGMSVAVFAPIHWPGFLSGLCLALTAIYLVPFVSSCSAFRVLSQRDFNQRVEVITSQSAGLTPR
jgi:F0F1-type ATP synthase assembly protein I